MKDKRINGGDSEW